MKTLTLENRSIKVDFDYDLSTWYKIGSLPQKEAIGESSYIVPFSFEVLERLKKWEFEVSDNLKEFIIQERERKKNFSIPELKGELMPFQKTGVSFISDHYGRCLIADDMGLGKTIQAIGYLSMNRKVTVIICPASIKLNWQREIEKWIDDPDVEILKGTKSYKTTGEILILNYDIAYAWIEEIKRRNPQILILDELTKIKTSKANRTKAILKLKMLPHIIGLSGTPIENRPQEIYNAGKLIRPDLFGTFAEFKRKYCSGSGFGSEYNGTKDLHLLNFLLTSSGFMLRRLKKDVLTELPEKTFSFVPMELTNRKEYESAENDIIEWLRKEKNEIVHEKTEALRRFETLKQLAVRGKLDQIKEWIRDFLETGNKLVLFCTHVFTIDELMIEFKDISVRLDGKIHTDIQRQKVKDAFQNDPKIKLFIGNILSASEGITLTASSNVGIIELPWSSTAVDQAGSRVHRYTQKFAVTIYYLLAQNTVEERIAKLLDKKRKMVNSVMNGTETEQSELLTELIKSYQL